MADRLNHNDEACFRAILADNPTSTTAGFTASIASLRGLIGELDHLRAEIERMKAPRAGAGGLL